MMLLSKYYVCSIVSQGNSIAQLFVCRPPKKCNCKKSRCLKLYCDCFAAGQYCKHSCSCQSCMNTADNRCISINLTVDGVAVFNVCCLLLIESTIRSVRACLSKA